MTKHLHPWGHVLSTADDFWHERSPSHREMMFQAEQAALELQLTITNGLSALNSLLIQHDDDLSASSAMDLSRLLASLGEVLLMLRLFEMDTAAIRERSEGEVAQ